jgi:quercetin dioxygenase-like cupin family protein
MDFPVGTWRSLVAHTLGVRGVGGSNPPVPTIFFRNISMSTENPPPAAETLKALVLDPSLLADYQSGAVVSRELIREKTGTVSVFAFDAGQGLSEHTAPFDAMVLVLDGRAEILIGGKPHIVESGRMIIMPAHIPHALNALERFKMMLVMIKTVPA